MSHKLTEAGNKAPVASADQTALSTDPSAQPAAALAFPHLCAQRPAIAQPLELLRQASWQEWEHQIPTLTAAQLLSSASQVFTELQTLLADHQGSRLEGALRRELKDAQGLALLALPGRLKELKLLQI